MMWVINDTHFLVPRQVQVNTEMAFFFLINFSCWSGKWLQTGLSGTPFKSP